MSLQWYVVHAYSGFENQVKRALEERIAREEMSDAFGEILVPTEEVVEMRDGNKRRSERKFFPGYVLVQMDMNEDTWHLVKDAPKVLGFIGGTSDKPAPITEAEAAEPGFANIFKKKRKKATDKVTGRQAEVEQEWDSMVKANYAKAKELAEKAKSLL